MTTITNLTPHPVTIVRGGRSTVYQACAPGDLPRAIEAPTAPGLDLIHDDTQGAYGCSVALSGTGVVEHVGYVGHEGLPPISTDEIDQGATRYWIVSIVTVLGAIAAGRPTCDLLVPMGQVRDGAGRIIGCTALAPADTLLTPMAAALRRRWTRRTPMAIARIGVYVSSDGLVAVRAMAPTAPTGDILLDAARRGVTEADRVTCRVACRPGPLEPQFAEAAAAIVDRDGLTGLRRVSTPAYAEQMKLFGCSVEAMFEADDPHGAGLGD
jgi:hypothetical protein